MPDRPATSWVENVNSVVSLEERIRELLRAVVEVEQESDDDDILMTGRLDSLSLVELIFALEQEFEVRIALDELVIEDFRSVRSIVALVTDGPVPSERRQLQSSDPGTDRPSALRSLS